MAGEKCWGPTIVASPNWAERARLDRHGHIHRIRRVIDDGSDRQNLGERMARGAEIVDDPDLRGAQVAGGGGVARIQADDPGRKRVAGEFGAGRRSGRGSSAA